MRHTKDNHDLAKRDYWRDDRDRITAWKRGTDNYFNQMEDGRGNRYGYDDEGQLTSASYRALTPEAAPSDAKRTDSFQYDELGNRKGPVNHVASRGAWMNFSRRDNGLNQYLMWENDHPAPDPGHWGSPIYYDENWGSLTPPPTPTPVPGNGVTMADGYVTASFNALNQPIAIWSPVLGSATFMWFGYDPLGRCVKRYKSPMIMEGTPPALHYPPIDFNPATYFYYDGWNLIQEGPDSGLTDRTYVHGGRVDEIVASQVSGTWYNHHYDGQGHCMMLTYGTSGAIAEQYDYDAFGYPYFYGADGGRLGALHTRFLFTGREYLTELRLYDYRNRMYQPEIGRFLQPDPQQFAAGDYNLYRYCHNDPVNKTDPFGLKPPEVLYNSDKAEAAHAHYNRVRAILPDKFKRIDDSNIRNVIRDAQTKDNPARADKNGIKPNYTDPGDSLWDRIRNFFTGSERTVTSYYDPLNSKTATDKTRPPIFGLANEIGEMFEINNGTRGVGGDIAHDNRTIETENVVRRALGATERAYKTNRIFDN